MFMTVGQLAGGCSRKVSPPLDKRRDKMVDWRESDEVNCSLAPLSTRPFTIRAVKQLERKESAMSDTSTVFVFVATYASVDDARQDYEAVKELHRQGVIGTY